MTVYSSIFLAARQTGMLVLFSTYKGFGTLSPRGNAFKADDSKGESNKLRSGLKGGEDKIIPQGAS